MEEMKKSRIKSPRFVITLLPAIVIVVVLIWFFGSIFEGEKPQADLSPLPAYLSGNVAFTVTVSDTKMGLRKAKVSIKQEGPASIVLEKAFPYDGLLNKNGIHLFQDDFTIDPSKLNLVQGQASLVVEVHDFSKRRGGDGNLAIIEHPMVVDTMPPSVAALTRNHNVNMGGSGLIIYKVSSDVVESGVLVNDLLFPGMPYMNDPGEGIHICYFAFPYHAKRDTPLHLWAKDRADNETRKPFFHHIRQSRFRKDTIRISDRLMESMISSFPPDIFKPGSSTVEKYLYLNKELRKENHHFLQELCQSSTEEKLWDGPWLRMKNAATMANFGDKRFYYYDGKLVDEAVHLGVDLASLARSPVEASNSGRVVFAQDLGIYGNTVVIDHGQGLYTMYGHLSTIEVTVDQTVTKGETIGTSGTSGLATGDHLHFGFLVHGVPVNPIEWWDGHWIRDNVEKKLATLAQYKEGKKGS
jgi:hypothetical protein